MTCLGEIQSPLEASVQELCNARLVEEFAHMDQNGPPVPPSDFVLRSASLRTAADIDPPPDPCGNEPRDGHSVAVYYREGGSRRWVPDCAARDGGCRCRTTPRAGDASHQGRKAVKARNFPYLLPICLLLFACGPTASRSSADAVTFDTAARLD